MLCFAFGASSLTQPLTSSCLPHLPSSSLQAYKNRCVLLRNSLALNCKTVEILEGEEESEDTKDVIRLNDVWSVQDKPSKSKGRYTFEVREREGGREERR